MSLNGLLLPYQINWLTDEAEVRVWEKSRRIGASYDEALNSCLFASKSKAEGGANTYYLSYNKDMTRQFIADAATWAKKLNIVAGEFEELLIKDEKQDFTIFRLKFATGHEIVALPSEARNLRSKQGRVVIDEAAFVDNLAELLKAALALTIWGGSVTVMSTHNGVDNPFNELVNDIRGGRLNYSLHRTTFDEALEQGLYKAICREKGLVWSAEGQTAWRSKILAIYKENADEELFCIPAKSGGAYFPGHLIEGNFDPEAKVVRFAPPEAEGRLFVDWPLALAEAYVRLKIEDDMQGILNGLVKEERHYFGFDFGRSGDLSVLWVISETVDLRRLTRLVLELRNCPFRTQEQFLKAVVTSLPKFSGGALDARGNGQALAEYARQTWGPERIHEIYLTDKIYAETFPKLKTRLEDHTITIAKDSYIRDDLRTVKVIGGTPRIPVTRTKDETGDRHGDAAIALNLANFAADNTADVDYWEPTFIEPSPTSLMLNEYNR